MRSLPAAVLGGILLLLAAAAGAGTPADRTPDQQAAWVAGDCARCHELPSGPELDRTESCVGCHRWIIKVSRHPEAREAAIGLFPKWERYEKRTRSYLVMPDFAASLARLDGAWVERYLADPHDLRPALDEGMPRFDLSAEQREALGELFDAATPQVPKTPAPTEANLARGQELFGQRGCIACHAYGGQHPKAILPMAPDLQHTRARMQPDVVAAYIRDPLSVSPHAQMPPLVLPEDEVLALRDFILLADPKAPPAPPMGSPPLALDRPVGWAEVEERVFGKICVHCHMDPAQNEGRAGPGNEGGFGWAATGIELQTRAGVMAVADRIPASLMRRRAEAHRDVVPAGHAPATVVRPERPGMPLGLPPLPDEDIALVLAWIAQGMPE